MTTHPGGRLLQPEWNVPLNVERSIGAIRQALNKVRERHNPALESIDPDDLRDRLDAFVATLTGAPPTDRPAPAPASATPRWGTRAAPVQQEHHRGAQDILASDELYDLAVHGHLLYCSVFADPQVRQEIEQLEPGDLLDLTWLPRDGVAVPRLPLGLLYREPPRRPIDPLNFLGLRLRLGYQAYPVKSDLPGLGPDWRKTTRVHALYWGDGPIGAETARHRAELDRWWDPTALPEGARADELAAYLDAPHADPSRPPLSLLYFYTQLDSSAGADPALRFGPYSSRDRRSPDVVHFTQLGLSRLKSGPVVFMNVCDSSASGLLTGNPLETLFLERGARSYIGTEAKVPTGLAARFATTLLTFLLEAGTWGGPAPVREATAQARIFLWEEFRSLGGLFYGHANDSSLTYGRPLGQAPRTGQDATR
jgi:hypothetical protein